MQLTEEEELKKFVEKTFNIFITLKQYKTRDIHLQHVMLILKLRVCVENVNSDYILNITKGSYFTDAMFVQHAKSAYSLCSPKPRNIGQL